MEKATISAEDLSKACEQIEEDIQLLSTSLAQLRDVHERWSGNVSLLDAFAELPVGTVLQVPLSESLYVSARLKDPSHVKADLGTGLYADRTISEAQGFFESRCKYALEQMSKADATLTIKRRQLDSIATTLREMQQKPSA
jgi:prefoldin alpha subunit